VTPHPGPPGSVSPDANPPEANPSGAVPLGANPPGASPLAATPSGAIPGGVPPGVNLPGGVSLGAVPPVPAAAAEVFGPALPRILCYAALLAGPGIERGLLGPAEAARLWDRHLLNCAAVAELVPSPASLVDLGSGPGLPGVVLALLLPEVSVTLLEPLARRADFLRECVTELDLPNATVLRGRAEDLAGQVGADVVTARAVAPLEKLAGLAIGLARPGGLILAIKGAGAAAELTRARPALRRLGAKEVEVRIVGSGIVDPAATVVTFTAGPPPTRAGRPSQDGPYPDQQTSARARSRRGRGPSTPRRPSAAPNRGRKSSG
jgi:16S rRNA (guanine527-N7)-methyltransferase